MTVLRNTISNSSMHETMIYIKYRLCDDLINGAAITNAIKLTRGQCLFVTFTGFLCQSCLISTGLSSQCSLILHSIDKANPTFDEVTQL